uniref:Uncharacterized protein n=1 Tax=Cuerna arida TaxID=1464854 RepID=A0A1B6FTL9_9HEMI
MSRPMVNNPDLYTWLCPLDQTTRNRVFDFGRFLEAQGVSNEIIVGSYRQICAKTIVRTRRLEDHEVYSYTRRLNTEKERNKKNKKPCLQVKSSSDLILEEDEDSIEIILTDDDGLEPINTTEEDIVVNNTTVTKTDDCKMCKVNVKEDNGSVVNIYNVIESSTKVCNEIRSAMNIDDGKPPISNGISEKSLVTNAIVEISKPPIVNSDESELFFVRNVETSIHVQEPASGLGEVMVNKNVDETLKCNEEQVETTNVEKNKEARSVDISEDTVNKSGCNFESKVSESKCNQDTKLQQNVSTKDSLKACKTACQMKIDVLDQENDEKNKTENMYLKILHENETVVELNNKKDLETENTDGNITFHIKPNECAGKNHLSKKTSNSTGGLSLENNVSQVNNEAKTTKEMETNSKLESEILTNKEKQHDKALGNNDTLKLQMTTLKEKLAQSLKSKNVDTSSSKVRQNKNVQSNLKCNTSVEKPNETHSIITATTNLSKLKTSDVEGEVNHIFHVNHNTSTSGNETKVVLENQKLWKEPGNVISDKHQTSLPGNSSDASIKSSTESNINLPMHLEVRRFAESSVTGSVTKQLDTNLSETALPVYMEGMGHKEDSTDCIDNVELSNDQHMVNVVKKTKTNFLQYKKGQYKQIKQMSKNFSLDKNKVRKTTELQAQFREFTSQVKQLDKQLTAKKHAIDLSEEESDQTFSIKRQRKSIDQMSDSKESSRPTVFQAKTKDSKDRDRNISKVPILQKMLSLEQKVNQLRNERKSLDISPVTVNQSVSDFTKTIISNGTPATNGEKIAQENICSVSDNTVNTSPALSPSADQVSASTECTNFEEQRHQNFQTNQTSVESPKSQVMQPNLTSSEDSTHLQNANKVQLSSTVRQKIEMNMKGNLMLSKASNIYTFYFGQSFDLIPEEIVRNINYFVQSNGKNMSHISTSTIVHLYLFIYMTKFSDMINVKLNKTAELLHLAIADWNRKLERVDRAQRLTSEILRKEEIKRADDDYLEMLNLRGCKFIEMFMSMLDECEDCEHVMLTALYFRITQSLLNIDRENINYIYTLRKLIKGLMKVQGNTFSNAFSYLFDLSDESFSTVYTFVKQCIVSLYVSGYKEGGSDDILRLAYLEPCGSKMQNLLAKYNSQQESGARGTRVIHLAQAKNDTVPPVTNERPVHHLTTSSITSTSTNKNIQPSGPMNSAPQFREPIPNLAKQQTRISAVNVNNNQTYSPTLRVNPTDVASRIPYGTNSVTAINFPYQVQNHSQLQTSRQGIKVTNVPTQSVFLQPNNDGASIQNHNRPQLPFLGHPNLIQNRPSPPLYRFSTNVAQQQQNQQVPLLQRLLGHTQQLRILNSNRTHTRLPNNGSFSNPAHMSPQLQASNQSVRPPTAALNRPPPPYQTAVMQQNNTVTNIEKHRMWHQQLQRANVGTTGNTMDQQLLTSSRQDPVSGSVNEMPPQLQDSVKDWYSQHSGPCLQ